MIDVTCCYKSKQAWISIWRTNRKTGAYQRNRYKLERGDPSEKRLMSVINSGDFRTEWINNQYNNHGEVVRVYYV